MPASFTIAHTVATTQVSHVAPPLNRCVVSGSSREFARAFAVCDRAMHTAVCL